MTTPSGLDAVLYSVAFAIVCMTIKVIAGALGILRDDWRWGKVQELKNEQDALLRRIESLEDRR